MLIVSSLFFLPAIADETDELTMVVKDKVAEVTRLINDKSMKKVTKDAEIIASIEDLVDFALMAKLSLGKKAWSQLSKAKRKEYTAIYIKRVKASYLEKLYLYTDEKVIVEKGIKKKKRVEVPSYIIGKTDKTEILYKFYKNKEGRWMVYDLEIAGVSVTQTYRSQFSEILKTASVEGLIDKLRSMEAL